MNVKIYIEDVQTDVFKKLDQRKHENYRGGFETIPDVVLFSPDVNADWRRRNRAVTLTTTLIAIEVKASERAGSRLTFSEIGRDIEKLAAHRDEARYRQADFLPVMMIIDTAPNINERMTEASLEKCKLYSNEMDVPLMYFSQDNQFVSL